MKGSITPDRSCQLSEDRHSKILAHSLGRDKCWDRIKDEGLWDLGFSEASERASRRR